MNDFFLVNVGLVVLVNSLFYILWMVICFLYWCLFGEGLVDLNMMLLVIRVMSALMLLVLKVVENVVRVVWFVFYLFIFLK